MVYLRAGWTLGNVPDRYVIAGAGGDQYVGRTIALLPIGEPSFAQLGPHFTRTGLEKIQEYGWQKLVPNYHRFGDHFKSVIRVLVANLCYHYDYLVKTLHQRHPLWNSTLFKDNFDFILELRSEVVAGVKENRITNVTASGIPKSVQQQNDLSEMKEELKLLRMELERSKEENKALCATMIDDIKKAVFDVPEKLKEMLQQHFDGITQKPLSEESFNKRMESLLKTLEDNNRKVMSEIERKWSIESVQRGSSGRSNTNTATGLGSGTNVAAVNLHVWGGKFRYVCRRDCTAVHHTALGAVPPYDFEFPTGATMKVLYSLWHCGNHRLKVGPYKKLVNERQTLNEVFPNDPTNSLALTKAVKTMNKLDEIVQQRYLVGEGSALNITTVNCDELFEDAFPILCRQLEEQYPRQRMSGTRPQDKSYTSFYNDMTHGNKSKRAATTESTSTISQQNGGRTKKKVTTSNTVLPTTARIPITTTAPGGSRAQPSAGLMIAWASTTQAAASSSSTTASAPSAAFSSMGSSSSSSNNVTTTAVAPSTSAASSSSSSSSSSMAVVSTVQAFAAQRLSEAGLSSSNLSRQQLNGRSLAAIAAGAKKKNK